MVNLRRALNGTMLAAVCLLSVTHSVAAGDSTRSIVVVNASVPEQNITQRILREIILGQRRFWSNGDRIELIIEAGNTPARRVFVETLSGMTESQFNHYWTALIFSHRATRPPRAAPDRRLALALVRAIPGALTIVSEGELPDNVRVVAVDGVLPGSENYPF